MGRLFKAKFIRRISISCEYNNFASFADYVEETCSTLLFEWVLERVNPFTPKSAKFKTELKILNFMLHNCQKQTVPLESTAR